MTLYPSIGNDLKDEHAHPKVELKPSAHDKPEE